MKLLVVSGFLGSGKTTLITRLAEAAVKRDLAVAVVVNEIGDIGIDDQYMRRLGMNVWEILGGCICCTLAGNLSETIDQILSQYQPDLMILEPSGAADLKSVDQVLQHYEEQAQFATQKIVLIDPVRFQMLMAVVTPLIESQIKSADMVLVNKSDLVAIDEIQNIQTHVREITPHAVVTSISAKAGVDSGLLGRLLE